MGDYGSGRNKYCTRYTVEDCRIPDASRWMREGILRQDFTPSGTLQWSDTDTGAVKSSIRYEGGHLRLGYRALLDTVRLIYA
jgi:hypothetical protein